MEAGGPRCTQCGNPIVAATARLGARLCKECGGSLYDRLSAEVGEGRDEEIVEAFQGFVSEGSDRTQKSYQLPYGRGEIASAIEAVRTKRALSGSEAARLKTELDRIVEASRGEPSPSGDRLGAD